MRLRRRLVVLVLAYAVAASGLSGCSSGGRRPPVATATTISPPTGMCSAFRRLQAGEADMRRLFPPLPRDQAVAIQTARTAAVSAVVAASTPEVAPVVRRFAAEDSAQGQLLLAAWGKDGTGLLADVDANDFSSLSGWVDRNGLQLPDGSVSSYADYSRDSTLAFDQLSQACDQPPAGWRALAERTSFTVPTGTLIFVSSTRSLNRATLGADGVISTQTTIHSGGQLSNPVFSPNGKQLLFQDGRTVWIASVDGSGAHQITPGGQYWTCPSWSPDSSALMVNRRVRPGAWVLSRFDIATATTTDLTAPVPFRKAPCGSYLNDRTLLVVHGDPATHEAAVYEMSTDGTGERPFASISGCSTVEAHASPDFTAVLLDAGCNDPYEDGVWIVPATGGQPRQVVTGHIGAPSWSPDGRTLLFGYIALGKPTDEPALWMATTDGTGARPIGGITGNWSSWPSLTTGR